jgi:hypothetical protein
MAHKENIMKSVYSILFVFFGAFIITINAAVAGPLDLVPANKAGEVGSFGIGAMMGSPIGATGKYWFTQKQAVDLSMGWSAGHRNDFEINSDYLWHFLSNLHPSNGRAPVYFGAGLRVTAGDGGTAGFRFPGGLDYLMNNAPVEFFVEIAPVFRFAPNITGDLDGSAGVRYYFK